MSGRPPRGRGAADNPPNRYHATQRRQVDAWADTRVDPGVEEDALAENPRTRVGIDRSRRAISYNDSPDIPFDRSLNPYRGCEHGCIYCYARPTHAWLDLSPGLDFETRLFHRPELVAQLRTELGATGYRPAPLALGSVTDAYQPIERRYRATRAVLELLAETRHLVVVITKSSLVERDIDLLATLAQFGLVEVAVSLTTLDRVLARRMEPRAATPGRRLETIARLAQAGIPVRAMLAPIVPVLADADIERMVAAAADAGASAADYVMLRLPLEVAPLFRAWLAEHYPGQEDHVLSCIQAMRGGRDNDPRFGYRLRGQGAYAELIGQRFELARRRHDLARRIALRCDLFRPPVAGGQLDLF
jgi:DNA repair photolyase